MNNSYVTFSVFGASSNDEITNLLGIEPDEIRVKGQKIPNGNPPHTVWMEVRENAWILNSSFRVGKGQLLQKHVDSLLKTLSKFTDEAAKAINRLETELAVVEYTDRANPGFAISSAQTKILAKMGTRVDADMYFLGDETL